MARKAYVPTKTQRWMMERCFLAGKSIDRAWDELELEDVPKRCFSTVRRELFDRLNSDPEAVKSLANGCVLNASEIIKYPDRSRVAGQKTGQLSILDICDGSMNA